MAPPTISLIERKLVEIEHVLGRVASAPTSGVQVLEMVLQETVGLHH